MATENSNLECTCCNQRGHWRPDCPKIAEIMRIKRRSWLRVAAGVYLGLLLWFAIVFGFAMLAGCSKEQLDTAHDTIHIAGWWGIVGLILLLHSRIRGLDKHVAELSELYRNRTRALEKHWDQLLLAAGSQALFAMRCVPRDRLTDKQIENLGELSAIISTLKAKRDVKP